MRVIVLLTLLGLAVSSRAQQRAAEPAPAAPQGDGLRYAAEQRHGPFSSPEEAQAAILRLYHERAEARRQAFASVHQARRAAALAAYARLPRVERGRPAPRAPRLTPEGLTFTVDSAYDERDINPGDGICANTFNECTLRAAIEEANAVPGTGAVVIGFAITYGPIPASPAGVWTIPVNFDDGFGVFGPLPVVSRDNVAIDGLAQPGASCGALTAGTPHDLKVVLDGALLDAAERGLAASADDFYARGLVIGSVPGAGVHLGQAGRGTLDCSYVGTDAAGQAAAPNGTGVVASGALTVTNSLVSGNASEGVRLETGAAAAVLTGNLIGTNVLGATVLGNAGPGVAVVSVAGSRIGGAGTGNVISGNGGDGVSLICDGCVVEGNLIGTNRLGTAAVANAGNGVAVVSAANARIGGAGTGNVISGNGGDGVSLICDGCVVEGNLIGTNRLGTAALGNGRDGVDDKSLIGGNRILGNTISANGHLGIRFDGFNGSEEVFVAIEDNRIGTDLAGTAPLGNTLSGVALFRVNDALVRGNVIGANSATGLYLEDLSGYAASTFVRVEGNAIGTDLTGAVDLGNLFSGIRCVDVSDVRIGGLGQGEGNTIAFNGRDGVFVESGSSNITVLGSVFYDNAEHGLDLAPSGVTPNDPLDADSGANDLTNFPIISSVERDGDDVTVSYSLDALPDQEYRVEFFGSPSPDPSGFGEARMFGGSATVTTDHRGAVTATASLPPEAFSYGDWVVATATPVDGGTVIGYAGTSEHSQAVRIVETSTVLVAVDPISPAPPVVVTHGDRIRFRVTITLGTDAPTGLDYWADAIFPNGNENGPYLGPFDVAIPPGSTGSLVHRQRVGRIVPPGVYTYIIKVGNYPNEVLDQDSFLITVLPSDPLAGTETVGALFEPGEAEVVWEEAPEAAAVAEVPEALALHAAYPNPTAGRATLRYDVPAAGRARLAVYDVLGRAVTVLADGDVEPGQHTAMLDVSALPAGAYLVRLTTADGQAQTQQITVAR